MSEPLFQLVNISSILREDLETFLQANRKNLNKIEWTLKNEPLTVEALHFEQFLLTEKIKIFPKIPIETKVQRGLKMPPSKIEINQQEELYNLYSGSLPFEQICWSHLIRREKLSAVVVGSPGSGKSFTTKYTVIELIDSALNKLKRRDCPLEEIEIPLWLTASQLAEQKADKTSAALWAIVRQSVENLSLSSNFSNFLKTKLERAFSESPSDESLSKKPAFFIVLDSLDELSKEKKDSFQKITKSLDKPQVRLIVTCRTLQWPEKSTWLGLIPREKLELAPLKRRQQIDFVGSFFADKANLGDSMQSLVEGNYALNQAFTNPLLLNLGCLLHADNELTESTTYVQIYGSVIKKMFNGSWRREKPVWSDNEVKTERYFGLLDKICWELFQKSPEINLFNLNDWTTAFENSQTYTAETFINSDDFFEELIKIGFIVKAGLDQQLRIQWSFAHRTFLEFIAARQLARRTDWLKIARRHFWFAPEWLQCLTFLAGLLDLNEARQLNKAVKNEQEDIFGSMILLEAKFTGAGPFNQVAEIQLVCNKIIYGFLDLIDNETLEDILLSEYSRNFFTDDSNFKLKYKSKSLNRSLGNQTILEENLRSSLRVLLINQTCREYIFETLINPIVNLLRPGNEGWVQLAAVDALEIIGLDDSKIIDALLRNINPSCRSYNMLHLVSIRTLGTLNSDSEKVIKALICCLDCVPEDDLSNSARLFTYRYTISALNKIGYDSGEIINALIPFLKQDRSDVVFDLASELAGEMGCDSNEVIEIIFSKASQGWQSRIQESAIIALGKLALTNPEIIINSNLEKTIDLLIDSLNKNDFYQRCVSARALGELSKYSKKANESLKKVKQESADIIVRISAALALEKLGQTSPDWSNYLKPVDLEYMLKPIHTDKFNHFDKLRDTERSYEKILQEVSDVQNNPTKVINKLIDYCFRIDSKAGVIEKICALIIIDNIYSSSLREQNNQFSKIVKILQMRTISPTFLRQTLLNSDFRSSFEETLNFLQSCKVLKSRYASNLFRLSNIYQKKFTWQTAGLQTRAKRIITVGLGHFWFNLFYFLTNSPKFKNFISNQKSKPAE